MSDNNKSINKNNNDKLSNQIASMQSQISELHTELAILKSQNDILKNDAAISPDVANHATLIFNNTSDLIFLLSVEPNDVYHVLSVNNSYLKSTGLSSDDVIGKTPDEVLSYEGAKYVKSKYKEAIQIGKTIQYEEEHEFIQGRLVVETTLTPIYNQSGVCTHLRGVARDVTERKMAEEVRNQWLLEMTNAHEFEKKKQETLQIFHEIQIQLSRIHDLDEFCRMAVEMGRSKLKYDRISLWFRGKPENVIVGSYGVDEHGNLRDEKHNIVTVSPDSNFGQIITKKVRVLLIEDTDLRDQHANIVGRGTQIIAALWDGEDIIGCLSVDNLLRNRDITPQDAELFELYATIIGHSYRQKVAEEALRKNESMQRAMISNVSDVIAIISADEKNLYKSPNITKWFGWGPDEVVGKNTWENIHPDDLNHAQQVMTRVLNEANSTATAECRYKCKDGSYKWIEYTAVNLLNNPDIAGVLINYHDISERKTAANALADEKERLRVTLQSIGDGVIATDLDGKIIIINSIAEKMTGYNNRNNNPQYLSDIFHVIHQYSRQQYDDISEKILKNGETVEYKDDTILISNNGTERIITSHGTPIRDYNGAIIGAVLVFRDVTNEIQIRQDIQRISKLDSLGVMAGGIAHDFNNLLTAIAGNIGLAQWMLESGDSDDAIQCLKDAEDASIRARELTQQLLTFAKGGAPVRNTIEISPIIHESATLALTGSHNRCDINIPDNIWPINADAGQLSQVLHNILINADQAMLNNGIIHIDAANVKINEDTTSLKAGNYIRIDIVDSGTGISPEIREKIFDPFFTTKKRGTGLGLTSAFSIVHGHDGQIFVNSTPGHGSTFSILLPAQPVDGIGNIEQTKKNLKSIFWHILVLDDEKVTCKILKRTLESAGHKVTTVHDGADAVIEWSEHPFDLGIFDLTIPGGTGGEDAIRQIHKFDPNARAIASSGYATDAIMANYIEYGFIKRLAKPYRIDDVLKLIKTLQEESATDES